MSDDRREFGDAYISMPELWNQRAVPVYPHDWRCDQNKYRIEHGERKSYGVRPVPARYSMS